MVLGCNHEIGQYYLIESVENPNGFVSTKCDSYENFLAGSCEGNDRVALGRELAGHEGDYFFETNAEKPYSKENLTYFVDQWILF